MNKAHGIALVVIIAVALSWPLQARSANLLFSENFESGTLGNCTPQGTGGDAAHITATGGNPRGQGSTWSARVVYQNPDNLQRLRCSLPPYGTGELFVRFYYRYNSDFHIHYNHKMGRLIESDDSYPAQQMELQKHSSASYKVMGTDALLNAWHDGPGLNTGWHKYELYLIYNSSGGASDGTVKVWIDDVLKVNYDGNARFITESPVANHFFRYVYLPDNYADGPDSSDTYQVDDIEIWDGMPSGPPPEAPTVTITTPTGGDTYQTSDSSMALAGTSEDDVAVTEVTWSNSRGGNGVASGTSSWDVSDIDLLEGENVLTITATDGDQNQGNDTLTVTYTPDEPSPEFIFSDNFDDGDVSDWNDHHQDVVLIDDQQTYGSSPYSAHVSHNPGSTNSGNLAIFFADNPTSSNTHQCPRLDEVYVEYFVRFSSASSWPSTSTKISKVESWPIPWPSNGTKNFYLTTEIDSSGYFVSTLNRVKGDDTGYFSFPQNEGTPISVAANQWHHMEIRLKVNTPGQQDGVLQMWVDGLLATNYENVIYCTIDAGFGWNTFLFTGYDNPSSPDNKQQYWDDITIQSSGIDRPAAPTGLHVVP